MSSCDMCAELREERDRILKAYQKDKKKWEDKEKLSNKVNRLERWGYLASIAVLTATNIAFLTFGKEGVKQLFITIVKSIPMIK